ncbi:MAG TPA: CVNH domain-containing protein [Thermoanaerobaculia bacterium]|jgi:CVNH domain-containing protein|nr:CVNH domain-containing protein [Thermoanaerobaculia bacterium]
MANNPPGSYAATSRNITFTEGADKKGLLSAECQQRDGSWVKSALKYDIANNNGVLMWAPAGID